MDQKQLKPGPAAKGPGSGSEAASAATTSTNEAADRKMSTEETLKRGKKRIKICHCQFCIEKRRAKEKRSVRRRPKLKQPDTAAAAAAGSGPASANLIIVTPAAQASVFGEPIEPSASPNSPLFRTTSLLSKKNARRNHAPKQPPPPPLSKSSFSTATTVTTSLGSPRSPKHVQMVTPGGLDFPITDHISQKRCPSPSPRRQLAASGGSAGTGYDDDIGRAEAGLVGVALVADEMSAGGGDAKDMTAFGSPIAAATQASRQPRAPVRSTSMLSSDTSTFPSSDYTLRSHSSQSTQAAAAAAAAAQAQVQATNERNIASDAPVGAALSSKEQQKLERKRKRRHCWLIMWLIIFAIMLFLFGFLLGVFINLQHLVELCGAAATTTTTTTTGHSYTNPESEVNSEDALGHRLMTALANMLNATYPSSNPQITGILTNILLATLLPTINVLNTTPFNGSVVTFSIEVTQKFDADTLSRNSPSYNDYIKSLQHNLLGMLTRQPENIPAVGISQLRVFSPNTGSLVSLSYLICQDVGCDTSSVAPLAPSKSVYVIPDDNWVTDVSGSTVSVPYVEQIFVPIQIVFVVSVE